jgi:hypothetical protein
MHQSSSSLSLPSMPVKHLMSDVGLLQYLYNRNSETRRQCLRTEYFYSRLLSGSKHSDTAAMSVALPRNNIDPNVMEHAE